MYPVPTRDSFIPNGTGVLAADDLDAAAGVHGEFLCVKPATLKRIMFVVTEAVLAATTAPQVRFSRRPTSASDTGAVVIGSLIIPSGTPVGGVVFKDVEPMQFFPGDALKVENTIQTVDPGSGTETGQGLYAFEADESPKAPADCSHMVESA